MRLLRRAWFIVTGRRQEYELAEELEFHREMKAQELRDRGVPEVEIQTATRRAMGNDVSMRQDARDVWVWPWLQDISQDVRFGMRMLMKDRRFTLAAAVALGLGIGVSNSVFTIINTAMFKELPFPEPSRLVDLNLVQDRGSSQVSYADYRAWSSSAKSFEGLAATANGTMNLGDDLHSAERLRGSYVSASAFRLLRVPPIVGRDFVTDDESPGAAPVAILSYDIWQSRYGGDESIVGHGVRINGVPATIVGVMPAGVAFPMLAQIWQPVTVMPGLSDTNRNQRNLDVFGRLAPAIKLETARAELQTLANLIAQDHPDTNKDLRATLTLLSEGTIFVRRDAAILATLMGAVSFVLLIACANVASLLVARSTYRSREMAIRASLGASRFRLVRQLLIECGLIAMLASVLGLWLSILGAREIAGAFGVYEVGAPGGAVMPYWVNLSLDGVGWAFLAGVCLFASLGIGLVPAWHLSHTSLSDTLKDGGRGASAGVRARRMTGGLLIAELALTLILLTGAGLMLRSFFGIYFTDTVIDPSGVLTARLVLPAQKYATRESQQRFIDLLDQRLAAVPLFSAATLANNIPLVPLGFNLSALAIDGRDTIPEGKPPQVFAVSVGPRYFDMLGLHLTSGRTLTALDGLAGQEGAIVNERFVAKFFPDGNAIGKRIKLANPGVRADSPWFTVVGVSETLPSFLRAEDTTAVAYLPMAADRTQQRAISIIVRTADTKAGKEPAVQVLRDQIASLDPDLPVFAIQTLDEALVMGRNSSRVIGSWFVTLAVVALVLSTVGLYALTAHGVAQRTQEIGVRMALGAQTSQIIWMFVSRTAVQVVLGLLLGLAGALALGKLLAAFATGISSRDPLTLVLVSLLLAIVAVIASVLPARRAARVDPVEALRAD